MNRALILPLAASLLGLLHPAAGAAETVAITGGKVVTAGAAGTIENGTVLIVDGKIGAVGANVGVPAGARRIDAAGKVVTPGLMDSMTRLGLVEVGAIDGTRDATTRSDEFTAAFDVEDALNPRSILIPVNRVEGLTRAIVAPGPGSSLLAGQGAAIHLGYLGGPSDILVKPQIAMFAVLGEAGMGFGGGSRAGALMRLREALADARDYATNRKEYDSGSRREYSLSRLDMEALQPVLKGEMPLVLSGVHRAADIEMALRFAKEEKLKVILAGCAEAWIVADQIAAAKVPILINPQEDLPGSFETAGATLENASRLHKAGVTFAFLTGDSHNSRNIRQNAGIAVANGLPWDVAFAAMTSTPAKIWGLSGNYGTLETGKDADVVIWDGDPLEVTSFPTAVFIRGVEMPADSRQLELRDRYKDVGGKTPPAYRN